MDTSPSEASLTPIVNTVPVGEDTGLIGWCDEATIEADMQPLQMPADAPEEVLIGAELLSRGRI